jgi:hypothetical protein
MHWFELLMHYNYEIHYCPGNKNCVADTLAQREELHPSPPDGEDEILQCLIPEAEFTELAACEVE